MESLQAGMKLSGEREPFFGAGAIMQYSPHNPWLATLRAVSPKAQRAWANAR